MVDTIYTGENEDGSEAGCALRHRKGPGRYAVRSERRVEEGGKGAGSGGRGRVKREREGVINLRHALVNVP